MFWMTTRSQYSFMNFSGWSFKADVLPQDALPPVLIVELLFILMYGVA
jgi:hypothetical protein